MTSYVCSEIFRKSKFEKKEEKFDSPCIIYLLHIIIYLLFARTVSELTSNATVALGWPLPARGVLPHVIKLLS